MWGWLQQLLLLVPLHPILLSAQSTPLYYDLQYFLPEEFLSDLPLRQGSAAAEVMATFRQATFPDAHGEKVDSGFLYAAYVESDVNSAGYKAARKICARVPLGGNPYQEGGLCERAGAVAPRALIEAPASGMAGRFQLGAEFEFEVSGYVHIWTKTCLIFCWKETVCNDQLTISGTITVQSQVDVSSGLQLTPHTVSSLGSLETRGCHPDWLVTLFTDVDDDIKKHAEAAIDSYVENNLQSQFKVQQQMQLMPNLLLNYNVHSMDFVPSKANSHGYVLAHASCSINATAPNGTSQVFPDPAAPWTGSHSQVALNTTWPRTSGSGAEQLVLLGGTRLSAQLLTMVLQGMHYVGVLSPKNQTHVEDAELFSDVDMAQPFVDFSANRSSALLTERSLRLRVDCLDVKPSSNEARYMLLDALFANVTQDLSLAALPPGNHTVVGLTMQLQNFSLDTANFTLLHSGAFLGNENQYKALALSTLQRDLPWINKQLASAPIVLCDENCGLVPFVPHPSVITAPPVGTSPGYVEMTWHCQCGSDGYYQKCLGFPCPEAEAGVAPGSVGGTRSLDAEVSVEVSKPTSLAMHPSPFQVSDPASILTSSMPVQEVLLGIFQGESCEFGVGEVLSLTQVLAAGQCQLASEPADLSPAYTLALDGDTYLLSTGCDERCQSCKYHSKVQAKQCLRLPGMSLLLSTPTADPSACLGGMTPYPSDALVMLGKTALNASTISAARIEGCVSCGLHKDVHCMASGARGGRPEAQLLCTDCAATSCSAPNVSRYGWLNVSAGGYAAVALATPELLPVLQACAASKPKVHLPWLPWLLLAAAALLCSAALIASLLWAGRRGRLRRIRSLRLDAGRLRSLRHGLAEAARRCWRAASRCRGCLSSATATALLEFRKERSIHLYLFAGGVLLLSCGVVWLECNPMVGMLEDMETHLDVHDMNQEAARRIVEFGRQVGFRIYCAYAVMLMVLSLGGLRPRGGEGGEDAWHKLVALGLFEGTGAVAVLALAFWQSDFSRAYQAQAKEEQAGDVGVLSGSFAATASVVFSIRLLLTWVGPFLLTLRIVPAVALHVAGTTLAAPVLHLWPYILCLMLTHEVIAAVLAITYFHTGYVSSIILILVLLGSCLNMALFWAAPGPSVAMPPDGATMASGSPARRMLRMRDCTIALSTTQAVLVAALAWQMADPWMWPFLASTGITAAYLTWAAVEVLLVAPLPSAIAWTSEASTLEPVGVDTALPGLPGVVAPLLERAEVQGRRLPIQSWTTLACRLLSSVTDWIFEKAEAQDKEGYGRRIKWRRICLLLGCMGLDISTVRSIQAFRQNTPWDDVTDLVKSIVGTGAIIKKESDSFLMPLVDRYAIAREQKLALSILGTAAFLLAATADVLSCRSARALTWSRCLGFAGSLLFALALLAFNMPDYVGLLDLQPTLGHCGAKFCQRVASSMRAAFGSGLLANAGVQFLPLLIGLPWTLFRLGFFLALDPENFKAVESLMWGTLTCIIRLSILPATVAYIAAPGFEVIFWYLAFMILPIGSMLFIVAKNKQGLQWYFLWGWVLYVVPLLGLGRLALQESWFSLVSKLWDEFKSDWPSFIAEFTLSDVIISDLFFLLLYRR